MMLFERIRQIYHNIAISQADFARGLGITPATFNGYLKESRQDNLWPLLPRILEMYPQINRNWLYFGEGDMLGQEGETPPACTAPDKKDCRIAELEAELKEERRLNRRLTERLLDEERKQGQHQGG